MKKFVTFSNFMVLLGIMTILFYLIPAVKVNPYGSYSTTVNLFVATFGGGFSIAVEGTKPLQGSFIANGGLITAFCLAIVAIVLTFLKCKNKFATLFAFPFYVAAGVLVACTANLVMTTNSNPPLFRNSSIMGGAITVATFWCILAFFALIDFIAAIAKPKQQPVNY